MPRKPAMSPQERAARAKERRIAKESVVPPGESEAAIQARIVEALEALGCLVERRGEAGGRGGKGGGAFKTGEPDLRVSFRGRTFGIEVKRDAKAPLREDQVAWYRKNSANVPYLVCCDSAQAIDAWKIVGATEIALGAFDCRITSHDGYWKLLR